MMSLSPNTTLDLFRCFERSFEQCRTQSGTSIEGVMALDLLPTLRAVVSERLWFKKTGLSAFVSVPCFDDISDEPLHYDPVRKHYNYTSPETLFKVAVDPEEATIWSLDNARLFNLLRDLLEIPDRARQTSHPEAGGRLWLLGVARLGGGFSYPIWLCRKARSGLTAIDACLRQKQGKERGLILTCEQVFPGHYNLPTGFYSLPIKETVPLFSEKTVLDKERLYQAIVNPGQNEEAKPVRYDHFAQILSIAGKKQWEIKGEVQAAVVEYLYQRSQAGCWEVKAGEILKAVKQKTQQPESWSVKTLANIFKGNTLWTQYISNPRRGIYSFNFDL